MCVLNLSEFLEFQVTALCRVARKSWNYYIFRLGYLRFHKVGTEELAHMEMIATIVHQLTRNLTPEQIKAAGFDVYFVDHTVGTYPQAAAGFPQTAANFQVKGDPITDLMEDLAAEQKARTTYDNILRLIDDPDICDPIKFLRQREIVHFQRFGEALRHVQENLNYKNFYAFNPAFDMKKNSNRRSNGSKCESC